MLGTLSAALTNASAQSCIGSRAAKTRTGLRIWNASVPRGRIVHLGTPVPQSHLWKAWTEGPRSTPNCPYTSLAGGQWQKMVFPVLLLLPLLLYMSYMSAFLKLLNCAKKKGITNFKCWHTPPERNHSVQKKDVPINKIACVDPQARNVERWTGFTQW